MNFERKRVAVALASAFGIGSVMVAGVVDAQDVRVNVTGSNIKRLETEGALPVQTMTSEDIAKSGVQSAQELVQLIAANNSGGSTVSQSATGLTTFSAQTASLRGLGGQRTLVLINGQRIAPAGATTQGVSGTDLSAIPYSAIERVEILLDGASAIYGSDAVGGVINFVLRQNYQGVEATGYYAAPTRSGGGDNWNGKITAGWGDLTKDRFNVFGSYYYNKQNEVFNKDRDFAKSSFLPDIGYNTTSGNTFPAFISTGNIGSFNAFPECKTEYANLNAGGRCRYDTNVSAQAVPELEQQGAYVSGRFQINADWQAYLNGSWTRAVNKTHIQPTPISDQFPTDEGTLPFQLGLDGSITIKPANPFYPTQAAIDAGVNGQPLNVRYRCFECGDRQLTDTSEQKGIVGGLKGSWKNWDFDITGFWNEAVTTEQTVQGYVLQSQVLPILNGNAFNPFGPNTPAVSAAIKATQVNTEVYKSTSKFYGGDAKASGEIYKLPAGPLSLAVGGSAWREEFDQVSNPILGLGDLTGYGGAILGVTQSRDVYAFYGELGVPILKNLEGTAAVRYDHYSDFGSTTNPKLSLRWQPYKEVLLRGSYGTGFIAPNLYQLYVPNTLGVTNGGLTDPLRCPTTNDANDCDTQFGQKFGGNRNLQPETSFQVNAGFVVEPMPGVSFSLDWFKVNISNAISNGVSAATILGDLGQYGNLVTRGPVQPQYPTLPGPIQEIQATYLNLGGIHIVGVDATLKFQLPKTAVGLFSFAMNGTYFSKYDTQNPDGTWSGTVSNSFGGVNAGITPRWKSYSVLTWNYGPFQASLANNYQSGYIDFLNVDGATDDSAPQRRASSMSLWDIQAVYSGFKNWTFTLGAKNMFDTNPPLTNQPYTFQAGYDPTYYDARARYVYGSVTFAWK